MVDATATLFVGNSAQIDINSMACHWDEEFKRKFVSWLRIFSFVSHIFIMSVGCYGFYLGYDTKHNLDIANACVAGVHARDFDIVMIMISLYMIILAFIACLAECRAAWVGKKFGFLASRGGRGFFMLFIGSLAVAEGVNFWYTQHLTFASGVVYMLVGFLNIASYACVSSGDQGSKGVLKRGPTGNANFHGEAEGVAMQARA